jgi:hypothetical protein
MALARPGPLLASTPGLYGVRDADHVAALISRQRYAPGRSATWFDQPVGPYPSLTPEVPGETLPAALIPYLADGEEVVWVGKPSAGPYGWRLFRVSWLFLALWTLFTLPGFVSEVIQWLDHWYGRGSGGNIAVTVTLTVLMPLPFILAVFMARARSRRAGSVVYAITRRRALIVFPFEHDPLKRAFQFGPTTMAAFRLTGRGAHGNILFESQTPSLGERATLDAGFIGIPNPREVAMIMREQAWTAKLEWR